MMNSSISVRRFLSTILLAALAWSATGWNLASAQSSKMNNYPTIGRVEYVQECVNVNGGEFALIYKCSCVIDKLAEQFKYDDFVEASTFVKYANAGGDRGGEFRDPPQAKAAAKKFRAAQTEANKVCGMPSRSEAAKADAAKADAPK
jgi:hypothetical protein